MVHSVEEVSAGLRSGQEALKGAAAAAEKVVSLQLTPKTAVAPVQTSMNQANGHGCKV